MAVIDLYPATAGPGPGHFLGNTTHGNSRDILNKIGKRQGGLAVVNNIYIYFIADNKEVILLCQLHHALHYFNRIYRSRGIVRINYQDAGDCRIIFYALFQVIEIRIPMVIRIKFIRYGPVPGMGRLSRGMRSITRGRNNHAGCPFQEAENLADGVTKAVKEDNIIGFYLDLASSVGLLSNKL